jgi:hypothetical protein
MTHLAEQIKAVFAPDALLARALELLKSEPADTVEIRRVIDGLNDRYAHPLVADKLVSALRDLAVRLTPPAVKSPPEPGRIYPREGLRAGTPPAPKLPNIPDAKELLRRRAASQPSLSVWPQ